jgi:mono/diheme cytochrome c family protein
LKKIIYSFIPLCIFLLTQCNDENPYKQGKILYTNFCANCHMENGQGLKGLIPTLVKADYLISNRGDIPCIIRNGLKGKIIVNGIEYGQQEMLPIKKLSEFEITNVMNYISTAWGNNEKLWKVDEVREGLKKCPQNQY